MRITRNYRYGDGLGFDLEMTELESGLTMNSSPSPTNFVFSRSHEELAGRKALPARDGLSLREPLETRDYCCRE